MSTPSKFSLGEVRLAAAPAALRPSTVADHGSGRQQPSLPRLDTAGVAVGRPSVFAAHKLAASRQKASPVGQPVEVRKTARPALNIGVGSAAGRDRVRTFRPFLLFRPRLERPSRASFAAEGLTCLLRPPSLFLLATNRLVLRPFLYLSFSPTASRGEKLSTLTARQQTK